MGYCTPLHALTILIMLLNYVTMFLPLNAILPCFFHLLSLNYLPCIIANFFAFLQSSVESRPQAEAMLLVFFVSPFHFFMIKFQIKKWNQLLHVCSSQLDFLTTNFAVN